jgi:hypothetical protein
LSGGGFSLLLWSALLDLFLEKFGIILEVLFSTRIGSILRKRRALFAGKLGQLFPNDFCAKFGKYIHKDATTNLD